jgi:S-adenosylmethionine:tRNA ribosyltransferase-isomerase
MRLSDFDYPLPDELIAQSPAEPRDSARLLVDRGADTPLHRQVRDLCEFLRPDDLLVVNDTRVIPARLRLSRGTGGAAEVLLLEPVDSDRRVWEAMVRPARKLRVGEVLFSASSGDPVVAIVGRTDAGDTMHVELQGEGEPLDVLTRHGEMPLPPYITSTSSEPERYQTVYARQPSSSAAPTAGLHFTPSLLEQVAALGVAVERVELVVGLDTFKPVSADDPREHRIHSERYAVRPETLEACAAARRVVAVGTTSVRALESAASLGRNEGRTTLFIHRPYQWKVVDVLMTNFHLPRTTLLMMIDAFVGERWRVLYREAIEQRYRFLSFGDAMLLDRSLS